MTRRRLRILPLVLWALALLASGRAFAQVQKQGHDTLSSLAFRSERLQASEETEPLENLQGAVAAGTQSAWASFRARIPVEWRASVDKRHGLVSFAEGGGIAWIPGKGNSLTSATKASLPVLEAIARDFLPGVAGMMGVDPKSLVLSTGRSGQPAGHLWLVDFDVMQEGMKIEGARVVFRVNNGNLIQIGTENLPVPGSVAPPAKITRAQALAAVAKAIGGFSSTDSFSDSGSLHLIPVSLPSARTAERYDFGAGRGLAKVWQLVFRRDGVLGTWQARVDAATGEVLELADINDYAQATGGIYQNSPATGPEVVRPVPFSSLSPSGTTNSAGLYNFTGGTFTSALSGPYVRIADICGSISQASDASGDIAFGTSSGTDCVTPGHGGAGNTHASREQFYQVNRIKEVARGWLPSNAWLAQQLTVNVNLNQSCNGYWNGSTLNFFKSSTTCRNTGEIAGFALHEFGHGLDQNDGTGAASEGGTGEAYGDVTAAIALRNSCIASGFWLSGTCSGYGDPCTSCTGFRDIDWAKHSSNTPATVSNFTQLHCGGGSGACGKEVHCESYVPSQAVWDFANRDLPNPGSGAAWTILDRLWFLSRSSATSAFTCTTGGTFTSNGCGTGSWWRTMRAVDDDDGNLSNGTPHGGALFAAFNRHGIACTTDAGAGTSFNGCTPPATPTLTATPGDDSASLSWTASGSAVYDVFRNETGCNAGFTKIVSGGSAASLVDTNVANGGTYYYQVTAFPSGNEACASAPSLCTPVTIGPVPDFTISCTPASLSISKSDSDTTVCRITSVNGFTASTALACAGLPAGVTCSFAPGSVTPPVGGSATSTLTVSVSGSAAPGTYSFQARGTSGSLVHTANISLTIPTPDFTFSCTPSSLTVPAGDSETSACKVTSVNGFASATALSCAGLPAGVTCSFVPSSVTPPAGGNATSTLTVHVAGSVAPGAYSFQARGTSGSLTRNATISLTVPAPDFTIDCDPAAFTIAQTGKALTTCTVTSLYGFSSSINFNCPGAPTGVTCAFSPGSATLPAGGSVTTTLTISVASTAVTGPDTLKVRGTSTTISEKTNIALDIATPVFVDDFETDQGWTVNPKGNDTATSGLWARAVPEVSTRQLAAHIGSFDLVTGPLLGSGAGAGDVDGGVTSIRSPLITLPASGTITISLAYYFGYNSTATADDVFRIRIVQGSTVLSVLRVEAGTNPGSPTWQTVSADISSFAGQSIRISIDATDDPAIDSIIEAAVDDVQISVQ